MKKPKSLLEALEITLTTAKDLKKLGVKVKITPRPVSPKELKEMDIKVTKKELPVDKWCHVGLQAKTDTQWESIMEAGSILNDLGISFGTGTGFGQRDWELDWSFSLQK